MNKPDGDLVTKILHKQRFLLFFLSCATLLFLTAAIYEEYVKDLEYGPPEAKIKALESLAKTGNKEHIDKITEYLGNENDHVRAAAVRALYFLGARSRMDALINKLSDPSFEVRVEARKALIAFGDFEKIRQNLPIDAQQNAEIRAEAAAIMGEAKVKSAVPALMQLLKDNNDSVKFAAAKALGDIQDPSAIDPLREILKDPVGDIRLQAVKSLVKLRAYFSVPDALNLLEDKDPSVSVGIEDVLKDFVVPETELYFTEAVKKDRRAAVRKFSAKALGILGDRAAAFAVFDAISDKDESVRQEAMKSFEVLVDNSVVFYLGGKLKEGKSQLRPYLVSMMARAGDPRAVPALINQLKREGNAETRELLQKTAVDISSPSLSYYLVQELNDRNVSARLVAIMIIENLKLREVLPELTKYLAAEKDKNVKIAMLSAMKNIGDRGVVPGLNEALVAEKDPEIKAAILEALKEFKDYSTIPFALECFKFGNDTLSMEAESFLDTVTDMQSIDYYENAIQSMNLLERNYALKVAKKFPVARSLKIALAAAEDEDPFIRRDAVQVLGQIGDRSAMPVLVKRLSDGEEDTRIEAVKSLAQMGDPSIIQYLEKPLFDKSPAVRLEAVKLYMQYGDKSCADLLNKASKKERDLDTRRLILQALRKFGDPSSIDQFMKNLSDPEPNIRREAALGLGDIGDRDKKITAALKESFKKDQEPLVIAAVMISLSKLGAKEMTSEFMQKLSDPSEGVSGVAREALDTLLDESDVQYIAACLQSESEKIREYCVVKLSKLKSQEAVPDLFNILKQTSGKMRVEVMSLIEQFAAADNAPYFLAAVINPATNHDVELQKWVIKNIIGVNSREAMNFLKYSVQNASPDVRLEAVDALGKIKSKEAQDILRYLSERDSSEKIRTEAAKSLK